MRVQRQYSICVPIPPSVPPSIIVAHLQTIDPVIRHLGTLKRYESADARLHEVQHDPFFHQNQNQQPSPHSPVDASTARVSAYQIYEQITLAPGLTKEVTYPAFFQPSHAGVRCRANGAAGITGWADYAVRQRSDASSSTASPAATGSTPSTTASDDYYGSSHEYEIHETLLVEANSLLMPFVAKTMEVSHRDLCRKIIEDAAQAYGLGLGGDGTSTAMTTPQDKMQE